MSDRLLKVMAYDRQVRVTVASTAKLVETARKIHETWPTATAAFGRVLTAAVLMACLGDEDDELTFQVMGSGPLNRIIAVSDGRGVVRGTVNNPHVDLPLNSKGKLSVGEAVGLPGQLVVIKDMIHLKQPYHGVVPLVSGEIGEDLAEYFLRSEQVPTAVGLGVKVNPGGTVITAGGFIVQALPGLSESDLGRLNQILSSLTSVTGELEESGSLEDFLDKILGGENWHVLSVYEPVYKCRCSGEKFAGALLTLGRKEIEDLMKEKGEIETICQFCLKKYKFSKEETEKWFS